MATWSIKISGALGSATFDPNPLPAAANDLVSWANETDDGHQLAVEGSPITNPIAPWSSSSSYLVPTPAGNETGVTYTCLNHKSERGTITFTALLVALLLSFAGTAARAQTIPCSDILNKELVPIPEIRRGDDGVLRGTLVTIGQKQRIASVKGKNRVAGPLGPENVDCAPQWVRTYIAGRDPLPSQGADVAVTNPLPGPTLRARLGDLVELTFMNMIESLRFPNSDKDQCDQVNMGKIYPGDPQLWPAADKMPDCFHESIYTNVHFHGTHTSPSSTADNVFLQIAPSPRSKDAARIPVVTMNSVKAPFDEFFKKCEAQLNQPGAPQQWPRFWSDLPQSLRTMEDNLLKTYAPDWYKQNLQAIKNGAFPQNYIGAFPYCFRFPVYTASTWPPAPPTATTSTHSGGAGAAEHDEAPSPVRPLIMGQAPGTHWYHAHKHGSTTINVGNGMTGVLIVEGPYDDEIKKAYPNGITQQVLVINQLWVTPNLETGGGGGTIGGPYFSVNGRLQPFIRMKPGEVQWWRIANTSGRAGAYFLPPAGLQWKQLAQDGVQFNDANYQANNSQGFLLAAGNRADLLVKAPPLDADPPKNLHPVLVYNTVDPSDRTAAATQLTLLNVQVEGTEQRMDFLPAAPTFPLFLADIGEGEVKGTKVLTFASSPLLPLPNQPITSGPSQQTIDGKKFDGEVGATVLLNQVEEWKVVNETYPQGGKGLKPIAHPFHIHINPFQIVEVFDPNATLPTGNPLYIFDSAERKEAAQCLLDPSNKATWKPCSATAPAANRIWHDTFSIPSGRVVNSGTISVQVPGYFKMRSRFVDYAGYFVLHCHILAHEDRGMMTVVYVTPLQPPFSHH